MIVVWENLNIYQKLSQMCSALVYVLESDDAKKKLEIKVPIIYYTLKKDLRQSKDFGQSKNFHYFLDGNLPSIK